MNVDPEIKKLQDSIQRSKVERAKAQSLDEKLLDGVRLFDQVRERMKAGIRMQHPELDEHEVHNKFVATLADQRIREEKDIYTVIDNDDHENGSVGK